MNENRVLRVEKRATNKIGLVILALVVIAGIGFGVYYVIKNKDNLSFYLPWEKNDDNDTREVKGLKSNKEEDYKRTETTAGSNIDINESTTIKAKLQSLKYDKENYVFNLGLENIDFTDYEVEIVDIVIDNFSTRISDKIQISSGASKSYDFTITKELLDRYRIDTFEEVVINTKIINAYSKESFDSIWTIRTENLSAVFPKTIQQVLEIEGIKIYYYRAAESKDNYFIYLLLDNTTGKNINYYYSKFVLDNKEYDASSYAGKLYAKTKYVDAIKIPKKDFRSIKDLTLRVMTIIGDDISISKDVDIAL